MEGLSTDVADFWVGSSIKVLDNPTSLEFLRDCVTSYQPAIIRGAISDWPAIKEWNLETVCNKLVKAGAANLIKVNITPDGHGDCLKFHKAHSCAENASSTEVDQFFVYPAECLMPPGVFYEMMTNPQDGDAAPYLSLQNDNLRLDMPELMSDIAASMTIAEEAFGQQHPEAVNLWIGNERSVSSIHKDHFENMYAVIKGAKTFILLPPTDILYLEEREFQTMKYKIKKKGIPSDNDTVSDQATLVGRVKQLDLELTSIGCPSETLKWICTDPDDPNVLEKFPNFHFAHPIRCTVQPGEILYIPAMWYHQVSQSCLTIAVNYWYDQKFDFRYCFYQSIKRLKDDLNDEDKRG